MNLGFFSDFKGSDTVLVAGTSKEIEGLSSQLQRFVLSGESAMRVHELAIVSRRHPVHLCVSRKRIQIDSAILWICSSDEIDSIQEKLEHLASSAPGHQYFELTEFHTRLIISVGEYDDSWWHKHG